MCIEIDDLQRVEEILTLNEICKSPRNKSSFKNPICIPCLIAVSPRLLMPHSMSDIKMLSQESKEKIALDDF